MNDNGGNAVNVALTGDIVWNGTGAFLMASLTIEGDARVVVPENVTLTVNGADYTGCTLTADSICMPVHRRGLPQRLREEPWA